MSRIGDSQVDVIDDPAVGATGGRPFRQTDRARLSQKRTKYPNPGETRSRRRSDRARHGSSPRRRLLTITAALGRPTGSGICSILPRQGVGTGFKPVPTGIDQNRAGLRPARTVQSSIILKQFCPFVVIEDDRVYREPYSFPDWSGMAPVLPPMIEADSRTFRKYIDQNN